MSTLVLELPIETSDGEAAEVLSAVEDSVEFFWVAYMDGDAEEWVTTRIDMEGYLVDENLVLVPGQTEPFIVNTGTVAESFLAVYPDESLAAFTEVNSGTQIKVTYAYQTYPDGSIAVTSATAEILP